MTVDPGGSWRSRTIARLPAEPFEKLPEHGGGQGLRFRIALPAADPT